MASFLTSHAAPYLLAPILLAQGLRVRARVRRLSEAEGAREGEAGPENALALRLLILGDSSAAGVGVARQTDGLAGQLLAGMANAHRVRWRLVARCGARTADALAALEALPAKTRFDLAVLALGVNDVTGMVPFSRYIATTTSLFELLRGPMEVRHLFVTAVPPMGRFPALPQPLRSVMGARAARLNDRLSSIVDQTPGATLLHIPADALDAALMAEDGFHPGPALYTKWGAAAAARILEELGAPGDGDPGRT